MQAPLCCFHRRERHLLTRYCLRQTKNEGDILKQFAKPDGR